MANTANLNLVKLGGTEKLKNYPTSQAGNMDIIDTAFGAGFGANSKPSVNSSINNLADGLAIIANGNTHAAITSGQFVYVRNHGNLSEGLYIATANVSANGTLSGSNLTADSGGGLNTIISTISQSATKVTNCNDATDTLKNYYCEGNTTNAPTTGWHFIKALNVSGTYCTQVATTMNSLYGIMYYRTKNSSGTWGSWREVALFSQLKDNVFNLSGYDNVNHISSNDNLNDYSIPGTYACDSVNIANTLANKPSDLTGNFRLFVLVNTGNVSGTGNWWGLQFIVKPGSNYENVKLYVRGHNEDTYSEWLRVDNYGYENILPDITWKNSFTVASGTFAYKSGRFINICVESESVSLSNNTTIGTISPSAGRKPERYVMQPVVNYTDGKLLNGSVWVSPTGDLIYYGDTISSKRIGFNITYMT